MKLANKKFSNKDKDLVEEFFKWYKKNTFFQHLNKWLAHLWKILTNKKCMHLSSKKHFDKIKMYINTNQIYLNNNSSKNMS